MPVTEIFAKDYDTRQRLEGKVGSLMGLTADPKPNYVIKGTRAELRKLFLGHGKIFWGIICEETDFVEPKKIVKVDRGEIHKSKLIEVDIEASEEEEFKSVKIKKFKK